METGFNMGVKQFKSKEDGCVYFFDKEARKYVAVRFIPCFDNLPSDIRWQIRNAKDEAEDILSWPIE